MAAIRKTGEVTAVQMLVEASSRDAFVGTVAQSGILPHTFPYGISHVLKFAYGKQILAGGPLSRQGFYENQELLDAVSNCLASICTTAPMAMGLSLTYTWVRPIMPVRYGTWPTHRCPHYQAQYLLLYNDLLKDNRPPFESDETHLVSLYQIDLNHNAFVQAFHRAAPTGVL